MNSRRKSPTFVARLPATAKGLRQYTVLRDTLKVPGYGLRIEYCASGAAQPRYRGAGGEYPKPRSGNCAGTCRKSDALWMDVHINLRSCPMPTAADWASIRALLRSL